MEIRALQRSSKSVNFSVRFLTGLFRNCVIRATFRLLALRGPLKKNFGKRFIINLTLTGITTRFAVANALQMVGGIAKELVGTGGSLTV
jgi:hypothetical protein